MPIFQIIIFIPLPRGNCFEDPSHIYSLYASSFILKTVKRNFKSKNNKKKQTPKES